MKRILEEIIEYQYTVVKHKKLSMPVEVLKALPEFSGPTRSFKSAVANSELGDHFRI